MSRDIGYDGIFLELQQDQNHLLARIAVALERIADQINPPQYTFTEPITPPNGDYPPYYH
jgi:hypothetical protein